PTKLSFTRRRAAASSILVVAVLLTACVTAKRTPNLERIFREARTRTGKRPIIVIPGVLGTELINSESGEIVWPSLLRSSDALPLTPDIAGNRDNLVPGKI